MQKDGIRAAYSFGIHLLVTRKPPIEEKVSTINGIDDRHAFLSILFGF
jgi:hypothetical protein